MNTDQGKTPADPESTKAQGESVNADKLSAQQTQQAANYPSAPSYAPSVHYAQSTQPSPGSGTKTKSTFSGKALAGAVALSAALGGSIGVGTFALLQQQPTQTVQPNETAVTINTSNLSQAVAAVAKKASAAVVTVNYSDSLGSGIILSTDGYILTNNHVVAKANANPSITLADGRIVTGVVVGTDPLMDLAVIKISNIDGLTAIEWGDTGELAIGDVAVVIGAPLGYEHSVTSGVISALDRSIEVAGYGLDDNDLPSTPDENGEEGEQPWYFDLPGNEQNNQNNANVSTVLLPVLQTDAAINPGNSGGALLNAEGKLIGVNVAIARTSSTDQSLNVGLGFAIPADVAKRVSEEIIANGEATHGRLGAEVLTSTEDVSGAVISSLLSGGAAEVTGLKVGDIVTKFNGIGIWSSQDLAARARAAGASAQVEITYYRDGTYRTLLATLGQL
ncbi:MAG: trypsin-like peptidase domain-containing protein [Microbacteriaceae bacterium]|nr:trypsin-like peptidase domain-containing protein [Microbacteriaceae bacterium]